MIDNRIAEIASDLSDAESLAFNVTTVELVLAALGRAGYRVVKLERVIEVEVGDDAADPFFNVWKIASELGVKQEGTQTVSENLRGSLRD